jgi:hypothetical protein
LNGRLWVSGTHSQIWSSNIKEITPMPGWGGIYSHAWYYDGSLFVAITEQIQVGIGLQRTYQTFGNGVVAWNWRSELGMHLFF